MLIGMIGGWEIPAIIGAAIILFGGSKIRDVARGLGAAKKEFMVGQAEADVAMERARAQARAQAEAAADDPARAAGAPSQPTTPPPTITPPVP
jgi:Sec-independent protein translocase protein TatA